VWIALLNYFWPCYRKSKDLQRRGEKRGKPGLKLLILLDIFCPQTGDSSVHRKPGENMVPVERWQQGEFLKVLFPEHNLSAAFLLSKGFFIFP